LHRRGNALRRLVSDLQSLDNIWLDISAMADPACFPLVGPFYKTTEDSPPNMTVASAGFHKLYPPDHYRKLRRDKFNYHFLYLKCSDIIGAFNYLAITMDKEPLEHHISNIIKQNSLSNA